LDKASFGKGTSVAWTKEETDLIDSIKYEMNRTDDGFDQEPPMVEGYDPADYTPPGSSSDSVGILALGAAGILFAGVAFFVYKKMFTKQVSKRDERKTTRGAGKGNKTKTK
jgi:hypothetical protein